MGDLVKKNGLIYTNDMHTVVGVDSASPDFNTNMRVPFGAHDIADEAFSDCELESISLPDSIKELSPCTFENCTSLTKVKLPSGLSVLPPYLFSGCSQLTKVTMPDSITALSEGVFYGCSSIPEIPFRAGIQEIPENCFAGCSSLKSLVIPNTVTKISARAMADCTNLETIVFPAKLYELAEDAFEGCLNIRNIRIDDGNHLFYVRDEDGCLYEKSIEGEDKCRLRPVKFDQQVNLITDDLNESDDSDLTFVSNEENETDDTFSSEVVANDDELSIINDSVGTQEKVMETENVANDVDSIFADIMNDERERTSRTSDCVSVGDKESQVLSEVMDVMSSSHSENSGAITAEELENLFASNEKSEAAGKDDLTDPLLNESAFDAKTRALLESCGYTQIIDCNPKGEPPSDSDLFVIAENICEDENKNVYFSEKLLNCVKKFARIQDYKRIILMYGLPVDNDEFMQFFFIYMSKRNIVIACEANSPSTLSDYCKALCEQSRISLKKEDLVEQRKNVSIKNNTLIKLIIQDKLN